MSTGRRAARGTQRPIEERLEQYHQLRSEWRRLSPLRIVQSSDRQITLLIRASGTGEGLAARFGLEDEPPHGLEKASFRGPLSTKANDAAVLRALD